MHGRVEWTPEQRPIVEEIRRRCLAFPEAIEVEQFGHPWFKAGKRPFCILGNDCPPDTVGIAFSTTKMDQEALCASAEFVPTPYMHQHGWTTWKPTGMPDWDLFDELVEGAYRNVALKRMLKLFDTSA